MKLHKSLLLFGASILLLAACGDEDTGAEVEDAQDDTEIVEDAEADEPEEAENEKEVNAGSRSNPISLGETVTQDFEFFTEDADYNGNRSITLSNVMRGEEVYNYLMEANPYNEEAPEGMEWIMVDVEYILNEADTEDESVYVMPEFVVIASDGSEVSQDENYATLNDGEEFGYVELYSGGSANGKYAFFAPTDDEVLLKFDDWNNPAIFFNLK
jgi:hypothetical protein